MRLLRAQLRRLDHQLKPQVRLSEPWTSDVSCGSSNLDSSFGIGMVLPSEIGAKCCSRCCWGQDLIALRPIFGWHFARNFEEGESCLRVRDLQFGTKLVHPIDTPKSRNRFIVGSYRGGVRQRWAARRPKGARNNRGRCFCCSSGLRGVILGRRGMDGTKTFF